MIKLIYIDLFCGGGGTTTGVHKARIDDKECAIVAACINHDANAIRSHKSNHKQTLHFTEDITLLYSTNRMQRLVKHVEWLKSQYPDAEVVLWASLECTNFSKAKGGQPRDADSRTLADHLFPYIEQLPIDRIQIENVEEFMAWGPLDDNGKPVSKNAGEDYVRWINQVKSYGYKHEHRILNAADFGAYTSRKRFFGQFARDNQEIYWPEQTHAENPESSLFGSPLKKWNAVRDLLDFTDEGDSMFDRKKPLVDATWERTYAGLVKFVAGGKKEFLLKYNSMSRQRKYVAPGVDQPCPTVSTQGRLNLCSVNFLAAYYGNGDNVSSVDNPSPTVTTKDRLSLIQTRFMISYNFKDNGKDINAPCPTILTKDRLSLIQPQFIMNQYTSGGQVSDLNKPCPAIATVPKQNLMTPVWLMNPQFSSAGCSVDKPCFTLIARMDKAPPYLVEVSNISEKLPSFIRQVDGAFVFEIYETDSEIMVRVKEFMAMYGILDIKMRMLRIPELKKIMGFPEDYILVGTQAEQKKFIGNAVEVYMATAMVEATAKGLIKESMAA